MSRASVKSIRQIRANESLQFRKTILKGAGNSASSQEAMANMAEQANAQYEEVGLANAGAHACLSMSLVLMCSILCVY